MGNLLTSILNSTGALKTYSRAFNVIQNNITNANTPGYVRQELSLDPLPFNPAEGLTGGLLPGPVLSARSEYLEQAVRYQQQKFGGAQQAASDLAQVEPVFDPASDSGIAGTLNRFFGSFAQLAVNPNDKSSRQGVLNAAADVAGAFHQAASGVNAVTGVVNQQTRATVDRINTLAKQIASINSQFRTGTPSGSDAGLDAQLHTALEELSGLANVSVIQTDGALNVYVNGETPLVIANHTFAISADLSAPQTVVRDSLGNDITAEISGGQLGTLLVERNTTLPSYLSDLNKLAQNFADTINGALAQGLDQNGGSPAVPLFSYNLATDAATTIQLTGITTDQIAAAPATSPGGNANALAIAKLADSLSIDGFTFTQFFGNLGARVGRDVSSAQVTQETAQDALSQAQAKRQESTGVSLDEEASRLLQYQQAYQAVGKVVTVLNSLTDTLLNMISAT